MKSPKGWNISLKIIRFFVEVYDVLMDVFGLFLHLCGGMPSCFWFDGNGHA